MDDTVEDMISRFLLGERRLLEKEIEGEPTIGSRQPTEGRFGLVDRLYREHRERPMSKDELERELAEARASGGADERDQATQMLDRWADFHLLGAPVAQRNSYDPSE